MTEQTAPSSAPVNNLAIRLDIDDHLTWGELIAFTRAAERAGVDLEQPVAVFGVSRADDAHFVVYVDAADVAPSAGSYSPE